MVVYDNRGYLHPFWNGNIYLYGVGELPRTITELAMCQFSARLRAIPGWQTEVRESSFRDRCRTLAEEVIEVRTSSDTVDIRLSSRQVEYVLDELVSYATLYDSVYRCQVSCFDRIWETTAELDSDLLSRLSESFNQLRSALPARRSHHRDDPNGKTVANDLVDPYMYPVVYGRTQRAFDTESVLEITPRPQVSPESYAMSESFACLPTLFSITSSDQPLHATASSYISGINPSLKSVYATIEDLLSTTIPLFEHVLTDLSRDNPLPHRIPGDYQYTEWEEPEEPEHSDDEEGWLEYQRAMRHWSLNRPIKYPDIPAEGYMGGLERRHSETSLRGKKVMVFTRIVDIHLRPNGPSYDGTPWHAEGMRNEHIAAVAMSCVSMNNITPPKLDFRMPVRSPRRFLPGDAGATSRAWGLNAGAASHQHIGNPALREKHTIAFPNIYQYRITEAHLQDKTKEGSMAIVIFCLVDPEMCRDGEVLSTKVVPPQCTAWTRRAVEASLDVRIPNEIIDKIMSFLDYLMTEEEATRYAVRMKRERELFWTSHDQQWFSLPFNIWEN